MRILLPLAAALSLTACAATPYDFAMPTMTDQGQAYAMTGYMKGHDEAKVRERLGKRMGCPDRIEFISLKTAKADNAMGMPILKYDAIMRCADAQPVAHNL